MAATAWTQADLDSLERAIATGARTVAWADGKRVTYRTLEDMFAARDQMKRCLDPVGTNGGLRRKVMAHSKGIRPASEGPFRFTS